MTKILILNCAWEVTFAVNVKKLLESSGVKNSFQDFIALPKKIKERLLLVSLGAPEVHADSSSLM